MRQSDWILDVFFYWNESGFFLNKLYVLKTAKIQVKHMIFSLLILISLWVLQ